MTSRVNKAKDAQGISRQRHLQMFCFPYAGGNARAIYGQWEEDLCFDVSVVPVDLPGRGTKTGQTLLSDLQLVAAQLAREIAEQLRGEYIFYGHSVGALVGFEVARHLSAHYDTEPRVIFASAFRAPHTGSTRPPVHKLEDEDLLSHVMSLGGVPDSVLAEPELLRMALPTLRADLCLSESYELGKYSRLRCPIYVYGGESDPIVRPEEFSRWVDLTSGECEIRILRGGHFFHEVSQPELFEDFERKTLATRLSIGR